MRDGPPIATPCRHGVTCYARGWGPIPPCVLFPRPGAGKRWGGPKTYTRKLPDTLRACNAKLAYPAVRLRFMRFLASRNRAFTLQALTIPFPVFAQERARQEIKHEISGVLESTILSHSGDVIPHGLGHAHV